MSSTGASVADGITISTISPTNWFMQTVSGNFTNSYVRLTDGGIDYTKTVGQSTLQSGPYASVGASSIGIAITSGQAVTSNSWFAMGTTQINTYYSYQSGDWKSANTWTKDPSGSFWITVTVNENTKVVASLEIRLGGNLDLQATNSHNFGTVTGQGTLKLSSNTFPGGTYTSFVAAGGGTVIYYNYNGSMPSQSVYNNLIISNSTNTESNTVLPNPSNPSNYTINGDMTVQNTGSGSQTFTIGNST